MRWLGFIWFAGWLVACVPATEERPTDMTWKTLSGDAPLVIAHRGASGELPEHTLAAYERAIAQGADFIEPDLVITRDGELVARHDRYLSTTTNVSDMPEFADRKTVKPGRDAADWYVEDFTLAELKTLRARQPRDGRSKAYDDQYEIPTFDEVLALVARRSEETGRRIGIYPEAKQPGALNALGFSHDGELLASLRKFGFGDGGNPVFIQCFEAEFLKRMSWKTDIPLAYLISRPPEESPAEISRFAQGVGANKRLVGDAASGDTGLLAAAHAEGLAVHIWTLRDDNIGQGFESIERELEFYFALGVDGVFADFPEMALEVRDRVTP